MFENSKVSVDSYSTSIEDRKKKCITLKDTENSLIEKEKV